MRWLVYLLLLLLTGGAQMFLGPVMELPRARGEYLFLLAFFAALHGPRGSVVPFFFLAGLVRDIFLGERFGAGGLLYTMTGMLVLWWRSRLEGSHLVIRIGFVFFAGAAILLFLPLAERTGYSWITLACAGRDALFTALVYPVVSLFLEYSPLRSWRDARPAL